MAYDLVWLLLPRWPFLKYWLWGAFRTVAPTIGHMSGKREKILKGCPKIILSKKPRRHAREQFWPEDGGSRSRETLRSLITNPRDATPILNSRDPTVLSSWHGYVCLYYTGAVVYRHPRFCIIFRIHANFSAFGDHLLVKEFNWVSRFVTWLVMESRLFQISDGRSGCPMGERLKNVVMNTGLRPIAVVNSSTAVHHRVTSANVISMAFLMAVF